MVMRVLGREAEIVAVDRLLGSGRHSRVALVLEGTPGIGKTTVWRHGVGRAAEAGYRVLSCRTAPTEARLSFTALSDLLTPLEPEAFALLPEPQRRALDAALLRAESNGGAANPRAIGTAVVSLLARLAATTPVLLAIDDLQWLDMPSARALEFALRRLDTLPIAVLATARRGEHGEAARLPGIDRVDIAHLGPLSLAVLYRIIEAELGRALPRPLLVKIEQACGGNPFYALEIARAIESTANVLPGHELPLPDNLRELLAKRLRKLPQNTREALLRVSALAQPTTDLVGVADLSRAEQAGVVRVQNDGRIEFTHPLFANAVYATATRETKLRLHAELAEAANDIEERARHLVLAQVDDGADERVADVLHEAAEHALRRGAVEVAAELDELSARRTPADQSAIRWQRFLRSARHHLKAGDPARTRALCDEVLRASTPSLVRSHGLALLAEASMGQDLNTVVALLERALACVGDDLAHLAKVEIALGIMLGALHKMPLAEPHLVRAIALAEQTQDTALLAEAIALKAVIGLFLGHGLDEGALLRALALEDVDREVSFQMHASMNVATAYKFSGHLDRARRIFLELKDRVIARGDEADLAWILCNLAMAAGLLGNLELAERECDEAERMAALNGLDVFRAQALMQRTLIRALRGNRDGARADGVEAMALAQRIGWPVGTEQTRWGLGILALSEADAATAVTIFDPLVAAVEARGVYEWPSAMALPDAIEALVSTGEVARATRLTRSLADCGCKFDRPWALATSRRCQALLHAAAGDLGSAAVDAEQAIIEHERLTMPFELGRTLLVYGQIQRRRGQRRAARDVLNRALAIFEDIGTPLWADMVRAEIARIGVRRAPKELTEGEERVAQLAAQGLTNVAIAARLFMSRRTVETNLARAYAKLGIQSRAELGAVMAQRDNRG